MLKQLLGFFGLTLRKKARPSREKVVKSRRKKRSFKHLTEEKKLDISRRFRQGETVGSIAKSYNRPWITINKYRNYGHVLNGKIKTGLGPEPARV